MLPECGRIQNVYGVWHSKKAPYGALVAESGQLTNQDIEDFLKFSELPDCHPGREEESRIT